MSTLFGLAPVIMVILAFGVIFQLIRPNKIFWFLILVLILPFFVSSLKNAADAAFSPARSWKEWIVIILAVLIGFRFLVYRFRGGK